MSKYVPAHSHDTHQHSRHTDYDEGCLPLPRFERVKYFYGQLLGVREFQSEQSYFREKHRLHNRYLHGYGVVCGLGVSLCRHPPGPCDEPEPKHEPEKPTGEPSGEPPGSPTQGKPTQQMQVQGSKALVHQPILVPPQMPPKPCIEVDCGLALDCQGNEIVVPWPTQIDLIDALGCDAPKHLLEGKYAYVTLCYVEQPIEPVRPLTADNCGGLLPDCVPSRLRDHFCVRITWEKPPHDVSCSPCARPCCEPCLPIARFWWSKEHGFVIDNGIRRTLAPYVTTKVSAISWVHDAVYRAQDVDDMLRCGGITIHFSDDVRTASLRRGAFDIWIVQGGGGRRGDIYNVPIEVEPSHPHQEFSRSVTLVMPSTHKDRGDRIDHDDRVLITMRSAFVLDRCCRAVDGEHIGGFVPVTPDTEKRWAPVERPPVVPCRPPEPDPFTPWMSGNGVPAGSFESWLYVSEEDKQY
ncbi:MAG TPA: hypothetical protein VFV99_22745 [Kofleriaceae bacterium]|nr:hypothetical protein [Kofleriaceae bacterium]